MEKKASIWECSSGVQAVQLAAVEQLGAMGLNAPRGEPNFQKVRHTWLKQKHYTESASFCFGE